MDVYRCKGILNITNSDQLYTLQVKDHTIINTFLEKYPKSCSSFCRLRYWQKKFISEGGVIFILQAVREVYEIVPTRKWKNEETRVNKIVFIGNTRSQIVFFYILLHVLGCICNLRKKNGFLILFFFRSIFK